MDVYKSHEQILSKGYQLLHDGDYQGALIVAQRLQSMGSVAAFEIAARAFAGMGQHGEAIKLLRQAVEVAPSVPVLWEHLGRYLSDTGHYEAALIALSTAKEQEGANVEAIDLNAAIVLERLKRFDEAWERLENIPPYSEDPPAWRVDATRIGVLIGLRRYDEALELIESLLSRIPVTEEDTKASVLASRAAAIWFGQQDKQSAMDSAWAAIALDKTNTAASWILRDIEGKEGSEGSKPYEVTIEGEWPESGERFVTTYQLVAMDENEAMAWIRQYEPQRVRESLKVRTIKELPQGHGAPRGVYWTSDYRSE